MFHCNVNDGTFITVQTKVDLKTMASMEALLLSETLINSI
jgi:hypothetical protein